MDYMRVISVFMEDKATITANWLSHELQVSTKKAVDLLQEFRSINSESVAIFRVVYRDEFGGVQVATVHEQELHLLDHEILSQQIYSIAKTNTSINYSLIVDAALSQAEELLKATVATEGSFLTNVHGDIHLSGFEIRGVGDRIFSTQNLLFKAHSISFVQSSLSPPIPSMVKASSITSSTSNKENKANVTYTSVHATSTQSATIKKINKSNENAAKKFFGAFVGAPKPLDPVLEDRFVENAGEDEEEWDDGKVKLAVRTQIIKKLAADEVVDFSSQETEADISKTAVEENDDTTSNKKRKAKMNVLQRGAMDDYMEDVAIEEYKRKQEEEAAGAPPLKKKKRILVEKSFMDSDGYFVTEMVWDEVTDDESEVPANAFKTIDKLAPNPATNKENNPTNEMKRDVSQGNKQPLKPKAQAKPVAAGAQKSMMSFFAKKT